ncbi:cell division protein CrgA [Bifidobacterium psychraerophilum]|uniref:cell division protein CrgA n=1 Tax=Bifidobacterium psychraerophilum TaxID=218140 RepID=UPI0039E8DC60
MAEQELHETDAQARGSKQGNESGADVAIETSANDHTESEIREDTSVDAPAEDAAHEGDDASDESEPATQADEAEKTEDDESYGVSIDKVEAVLNATVDKSALTPQMKRMMQRQDDNTKRVEESIKGTKANPGWFVPLFCTLMVIGLIWCVVYYITGSYPIPNISAWNLAIGFAFIMLGFIMTMWWR